MSLLNKVVFKHLFKIRTNFMGFKFDILFE